MKEAKVRNSRGDTAAADSQARIIPLDLDLARRPFDVSAKRKCYIIFDKGPPPVLQEIDCGDIVIVDEKFTMYTPTLCGPEKRSGNLAANRFFAWP